MVLISLISRGSQSRAAALPRRKEPFHVLQGLSEVFPGGRRCFRHVQQLLRGDPGPAGEMITVRRRGPGISI